MKTDLAQPDISALIEAKDFAAVKATIRDMEVHDLAELLGDLVGETLAVAFRLLSPDRAGEILGEFEPEQQEALLTTLSSEKVAAILSEMPPDDRTELLEELPGQLAQRLLAGLRGDDLKIARNLLAYPEDSIGRLMTPEYVAVQPDWKIQRVFEHVRKVGKDTETINVIYVVDDHWKLLDELRLEQLVLADPDQTVRDLMDEQVASLHAADDQESAVESFKKYDAVALPVVDGRGVLVGIVTHDDVLDLAEEEYTEDMQKMAGVAALDHPYFQTSYRNMLRKRLPCLVLLSFAGVLTAMGITAFEHSLGEVLVLVVVFVPLLNDSAGNVGSQMSALVIRGLAVKEMKPSDWLKVCLLEARMGMSLGAVLGGLACLSGLFLGRSWYLSLALGLSMVAMLTIANLIGAMLPFALRRIRVDPAVTSGPLITSVMDVLTVVIYLSISLAFVKAFR